MSILIVFLPQIFCYGVTPSMKKRDAEASVKKILDTAQILFAQRGYHATSLGDIAHECGLSRSTPSYFFKNKELLYKKVIERLIVEEKKYVNTLGPRDELTVDSLKTLLTRHIEYTFKHPHLCKILIWESLNENRQAWIFDYFPEMTSWSLKYLERAQEMGLVRRDVDTFSLWLNAMAMGWLPIITQHTFFKSIGKDVFDEAFIADHVDQVKRLIFESILVEEV